MKFINLIAIGLSLACMTACSKKPVQDISQLLPEYKLINEFSNELRPETGLVLSSYGVNKYLPDDYKVKNAIASFSVGYKLIKTKQDAISLEEARCLLVSITEGLKARINANLEIRSRLDTYPISSDFIRVSIHFKDEKMIGLGSGVSEVFFTRGEIMYRRYEIREYTGKYPAKGTHYLIKEETYAEALDIIKNQGQMIPL